MTTTDPLVSTKLRKHVLERLQSKQRELSFRDDVNYTMSDILTRALDALQKEQAVVAEEI